MSLWSSTPRPYRSPLSKVLHATPGDAPGEFEGGAEDTPNQAEKAPQEATAETTKPKKPKPPVLTLDLYDKIFYENQKQMIQLVAPHRE